MKKNLVDKRIEMLEFWIKEFKKRQELDDSQGQWIICGDIIHAARQLDATLHNKFFDFK